MGRPLRLDYAGARHHVMNHAAHHDNLFRRVSDRRAFLCRARQLEERFHVRVFAYALMPNHFHLLVESQDAQLADAMHYLTGPFARRLNLRDGGKGPVFQNRYVSRLVDEQSYWLHLFAYVHLNPAKHWPGRVEDPLWTSHRPMLLGRADWLRSRDSLRSFGGVEAFEDYVQDVRAGRQSGPLSFDSHALWDPRPTGAEIADALDRVQAGWPREKAAIWLAGRGLSHRRVGRIVGVGHSSVGRWVRDQ